MKRNEFYRLLCDPDDLAFTRAMIEYDRLTEINSQLLLACKAARRHLTEDGVQDFEPIIIQLRAAIAAEEGR